MAPSDQIFAVPELLENILLSLPERDLLLVQRVNQVFRNVIKTSPGIQRKLFYTADLLTYGDLPCDLKWNPFPEIVAKCGDPDQGLVEALAVQKMGWVYKDLRSTTSTHQKQCGNRYPWEIDVKTLEKADYPTASWKGMFLTQPAFTRVTMTKATFYEYSRGDVILGTIEDADGVKLGRLRDDDWIGNEVLWED